jgi:anaerobic magnesium-protoporphyrin IX monomethyl ester cyclase
VKVLLVSGLGPSFKDQHVLANSSFLEPRGAGAYDLSRLRIHSRGALVPLLRRRGSAYPVRPTAESQISVNANDKAEANPHLTTFTLRSILERARIDYDFYPIERIWEGGDGKLLGCYDVVLLSTTFIWDRRTLARAITWVGERWPDALVVLGGQYSNLKYNQILRSHPSVGLVVRGDAEVALPRLLKQVRGDMDLDSVPNLVWRDADSGRIKTTAIEYVDLDQEPSPTFGERPIAVVPYESMRGCPFSCRYCSFPAASPKWRYKSARKIAGDFRRYRDENGARYIKALDSTFTVPPIRLRELLPMLETVGVQWEAFSRANTLRDEQMVTRLLRAHCAALSIGFESMNDRTLKFMHKQVTAAANRRAFILLQDSGIDYKVQFIVGYPGESPELHQATRDFLVNEYQGRFSLNLFTLKDETMPVWQEAERFELVVDNMEDPDEGWSHVGMDLATAKLLQMNTLKDVRWGSDRAINRLWQHEYEIPMAPERSPDVNRRIEKLIDRLGMIASDFSEPHKVARRQADALLALRECGVAPESGECELV